MTLIIAEAGVNHNGSEELAIQLVDAAFDAGADIVKFQTFKAKNLVTESAKQAEYQTANTGKSESQLAMLTRLELSFDAHKRLVAHCNKLGIEFLSTAFDSESLSFLINDLGLNRLKIPSGEITNAPLILEHAITGCDLIVSTGMATMGEIESALGVIAFGYLYGADKEPSVLGFQQAYASEQGQRILKEKVTILHCTSEYPAPFEEINLRVMETFKHAFGLKVGYSDHSAGISIPIAVTALGATVIEKHFTLDKGMEGPDHKASLDPAELKAMVKGVREVQKAMGSSVKSPTVSEVRNRPIVRKSIVALQSIAPGQTLNSDNIGIKRPGTGLCPSRYWDLLGSVSTEQIEAGAPIELSKLSGVKND